MPKTKYRVFIASPGDLAVERQAFRKQLEELNIGFGDGAGVEFEALGWEDTLAVTGRRPQGLINQDIDSCDVFILVLHRRWGQEAPDSEFSSYTEEEYYRAIELYKRKGSPEIFVFFKKVDSASIADPGVQLQKVLDFKLQLEATRYTLYKQFDTEADFKSLVDQHLRAFAKGDYSPKNNEVFTTPLPVKAIEEINKAKAQLEIAMQKANGAEGLAIELSKVASELALKGNIEKARVKFAKAIEASNSYEVLRSAVSFYQEVGELDEVEKLSRRAVAHLPEEKTASFVKNLAVIYHSRGEVQQAEEMYFKCIRIFAEQGNLKCLADVYQGLGSLFTGSGEINGAETMHRLSLAINKKIDDPKKPRSEALDRNYGDLGNLLILRGEIGQAEEMYHKRLKVIDRFFGNEKETRKLKASVEYFEHLLQHCCSNGCYKPSNATKGLVEELSVAECLYLKNDRKKRGGKVATVEAENVSHYQILESILEHCKRQCKGTDKLTYSTVSDKLARSRAELKEKKAFWSHLADPHRTFEYNSHIADKYLNAMDVALNNNITITEIRGLTLEYREVMSVYELMALACNARATA